MAGRFCLSRGASLCCFRCGRRERKKECSRRVLAVSTKRTEAERGSSRDCSLHPVAESLGMRERWSRLPSLSGHSSPRVRPGCPSLHPAERTSLLHATTTIPFSSSKFSGRRQQIHARGEAWRALFGARSRTGKESCDTPRTLALMARSAERSPPTTLAPRHRVRQVPAFAAAVGPEDCALSPRFQDPEFP